MPSIRRLAALTLAALIPATLPAAGFAADSATLVFDFVTDPGDVADGPDYIVTATGLVDDGTGCDAVVAIMVDATGTEVDVDSFCLDLGTGIGGSDGDYGSFGTGYLPTAGPATYAIYDITAADLTALMGLGDTDVLYASYVKDRGTFLVEGFVDVEGLESGTPFSLGGGAITGDYQCYQAKDLKSPKFVPVADLAVTDSFAASTVDVKKPYQVCTPATTDGSPVSDTAPNLCCYKMKGTKLPAAEDVQTEDGFGTLQIELRTPKTFCRVCTRSAIPVM
jgi:hypothetical protein